MDEVAIVGAGTMGGGIAQVFAQSGTSVHLIEVDRAQLERGLSTIRLNLQRAAEKGRASAEEVDAAVRRVHPSTSLEDARGCPLVVEAIFEDVEAKREVFRQLDSVCDPDAILASNTSSISITTLASATRRPTQVIGMHFFNPVPVMRLVEVVRGYDTSDETFEAVVAEARRLGKEPVEVRDFPGFVSNRILMPLINEAIFSLYEGVAGRDEIDQVARLGLNHPMGPLQLADLIGLDVCLHIMTVLHEGFGDPKYRPCPLLRQMVAAGRLGRKSGHGFYDYD